MHHPSLRPSASQVVLSGPREAVMQTAAAIEELTREELPLEVQQALSRMLDEEKLVSVPANRVGRVIGSRGAVIQARRTTYHLPLATRYLLLATCYLLLATYLLATHHPPLTTDCLPRCSRRCVWRRVPRSTCRRITPPGRPPWRYAARRRQWPRPSSPSSASSRRALKRDHSYSLPVILYNTIYLPHRDPRGDGRESVCSVCRFVAKLSLIRI